MPRKFNSLSIASIAATALLFLTGCHQSSFQKYAEIDQSEKTIAITGMNKFIGELKHELRAAGWKTYAYNLQTLSSDTKQGVKTSKSPNARYTLGIDGKRIDLCLDLDELLHISATLVDNKTNEEVFNYSGSRCASLAKKELLALLNNTEKKAAATKQ